MSKEDMPGLVGELYWRQKNGVTIELKRVGAKQFHELLPGVKGLPVVYAVWPEPMEDGDD